jgi:hypothetical protein
MGLSIAQTGRTETGARSRGRPLASRVAASVRKPEAQRAWRPAAAGRPLRHRQQGPGGRICRGSTGWAYQPRPLIHAVGLHPLPPEFVQLKATERTTRPRLACLRPDIVNQAVAHRLRIEKDLRQERPQDGEAPGDGELAPGDGELAPLNQQRDSRSEVGQPAGRGAGLKPA